MNKRALALTALVLAGVFQLAVVASLVWKQERLLSSGTEYRFRLIADSPEALVVRDRKVSLFFVVEKTTYARPAPRDAAQTEELYAKIVQGSDGYARIETLRESPGAGDWLKVECLRGFSNNEELRIRLPFRSYYVSEGTAKRLADGKSRSETPTGLYATVRVRAGEGTLTGLWTSDGPLR